MDRELLTKMRDDEISAQSGLRRPRPKRKMLKNRRLFEWSTRIWTKSSLDQKENFREIIKRVRTFNSSDSWWSPWWESGPSQDEMILDPGCSEWLFGLLETNFDLWLIHSRPLDHLSWRSGPWINLILWWFSEVEGLPVVLMDHLGHRLGLHFPDGLGQNPLDWPEHQKRSGPPTEVNFETNAYQLKSSCI